MRGHAWERDISRASICRGESRWICSQCGSQTDSRSSPSPGGAAGPVILTKGPAGINVVSGVLADCDFVMVRGVMTS